MTVESSSLSWCPTGGREHADIRTADGHLLASYHWGGERNHPYFHPVYGRSHSGILTNHAPWDHRWHHGLWWSWKYINDVLYWEDHAGHADAKQGLGHSVVTSHTASTTAQGGIEVAQQLTWCPQESDSSVLNERRNLTLHPTVDNLPDAWAMDWDLSFTAQHDAQFSTTPYPEKWWGGYAGLNYRPARSMAAGEVLLGSGGRQGAEALHGEPAGWCAYFGRTDGVEHADPDSPAVGGVAILTHPNNPRHPVPAYTVSAAQNAFAFLAAAPLMRADLNLDCGEELRVQYRVVVLGDYATHDALDRAYTTYANAVSS